MILPHSIERSAPCMPAETSVGYLDALVNFSVSVGGVRQGDRVADVSAGSGRLAGRLHHLGAHVIPVDWWPSARTSPCRLEPGSIDVAFIYMVLHHVGHPALTISELKRAIKPGGRLVITEMARNDDQRFNTDRREPWVGLYTSDIRHWLQKEGFSNIIVNPVPFHLIGVHQKSAASSGGAEILMATGTAT